MAGVMDQWLRTLIALEEHVGSVPRTHSGSTQLPAAPLSEDLTPFPDFHQDLHAHGTNKSIQVPKHIKKELLPPGTETLSPPGICFPKEKLDFPPPSGVSLVIATTLEGRSHGQ